MVATTLSVGDVGIVGADTEDNGNPQRDSITFILLKPIGSGTVIYFTDRAWNGTSFAAPSAGEGTFTYTTGVDLAAGTVITITQAQLTAAGINLSDVGETIYAYQGTSADAPTRFLHAVELGDGNTTFNASLVNTGLAAGTSAVALNTDNAEFGTRTHNIQLSELFAQINNRTDWVQNDNSPQDGTAAGSPVLTAPDAQIWVGGSGGGEGIVTINLDGTYSAGTLGYQIVQAFQNEANLFHPSDITLDTVEDKYFFVDSDGNGNNRIIQGSISQLLANPGGAITTTVLYTNAGSGATGIIQSLAVDTINNKIYFDVGTLGNGSEIRRIDYNTTSQAGTLLATLGPDRYVTQMAIDFTRGAVFLATSQVQSVFGTDALFQNYVYRASAGSAAALSTAGSLTFAELPFNPDDTGQTGEGGPLPGEAFPVEFGSIRGIDVDPVSNALIIVTGSIILDNDGNGNTTYTGRIIRYALDSNPTGNITTLFQQTGTPGQPGTGPRGLLYHVEADAATGRYYVVDESGLNSDPGDASVWTGSLTVAGTPTLVGVVGNINGLGARGLEILHAPTLTGTNLAPTTTEAAGNPSPVSPAVAVANAFTASDNDSSNSATDQLAGAQVRISSGFLTGVDVLSVSGALPTGITASYNATTGVLALSGISTFANYQTALAQVRFAVQGDNPTSFGTNAARTLAISTFDGALYSDEVTATVSVVASNDAPTSTGLQGDSVTTTEPAGAGSVMPSVNIDAGANATFADVDSLNFNGGTLRFAITAGKDAAQDQLNIDTTGIVTITAGTISVSGTAIGTVTGGGAGGGDIVITLNANATPALAQSVARVVFFGNTGGDNPTAGARTITTTLVDGGGVANSGTDTLTITSTVNVVPTNDAPTITGLPASLTAFLPGVPGIVDLSASTIADVDSATVTATLTATAPGTFLTASVAGVTIGGSANAPTLTGTVAAINSYLDTPSNVQFAPGLVNGIFGVFINVSDGALSTGAQGVGSQITFTPQTLTTGSAATENFNNLAISGTGTVTPLGWAFNEAGGNSSYTAGTGSSVTGDTYSFGATGNGDRAFGSLQSGTNVPTIGGAFTNTSGVTLTSLLISYIGEQWRQGNTAATPRPDRLDFQISFDATSLTTGAWQDVNALDFTGPIQGITTATALDGNLPANRTAISSEITGLTIANGTTFWIRWNNFDATGSDDGLAVDDFSITARALNAVADAGGVFENATITNGNLFTNDITQGGAPALAVASVNGLVANVGTQFALASGALLTVNANGTYSYNPNGAFNYLIDAATAAATGATNTSATDTFTYTLAGATTALQTATVTVTINGVAGTGDQLRGTVGNNTLNGTPLDDFLNLAQGGDDFVTGGVGNDGFFFGSFFTTADTVDGGPGTNDQVGLQGNYSALLTLGAGSLVNVEVISVLPGFSYNIASVDANVPATQELSVFGGNLLAGNNFTFNGSAETDGRFRMFGGLGNDTFTGGALDDGFYFGPGRWGPGDTLVGGGGTNDQLALDGNYTVLIGANAGVETLILLPGPGGSPNTFDITLDNVWTPNGATRTVWGLNVTTSIRIDATAEADGNLIMFGGQGSDNLLSGSGADVIYGGGAGDFLFGGSGADTFRFDAITDSNGATNATRDRIVDFASGVDKIDLSRIDAIAGGADDAFSFIGAGAFTNVAGQLRYTDTGAGGIFIVEGDVNGDGVADFTLSVTMTPATPPLATDFIL